MKPVLVLTATGQVGRHVVSGLSDAGIPVRAVTRSAERAKELFAAESLSSDSVEFIQGDVRDRATMQAAASGCGQAYIASADAPDQVDIEVNATLACLDAGVEHVVKLSSCDAAADAPFAWARNHAEIEKRMAASTSGYSFLRPHYFMQNVLSFVGEINETGAISLPAGEGRVGMIDARDIALAAVRLLTDGAPLRRAVVLTGREPVSFRRVAEAISTVRGALVEYRPVSDGDYLRKLVEVDGMSEIHAAEIARVYRDARNGVLNVHTDEFEKLTGHWARTIEQFVSDHAARFSCA